MYSMVVRLSVHCKSCFLSNLTSIKPECNYCRKYEFSTALQNLGKGEWAVLATLISLLCDLLLTTIDAFRMFREARFARNFHRKKVGSLHFYHDIKVGSW